MRAFAGLVDARLDGAVADALDGDAVLQRVELLLGDAAVRPGAIAALQARGRQLQGAGQRPVIGEQQQAFGVQVQTTDGDQPRQPGRQGLEDGGAPRRIGVGGHQAGGLVIAEEAGRLAVVHHLAVDGEDVVGLDLDRRRGQNLTVQGHPAGLDQALHLSTGGDAGACQGLGHAFAATLGAVGR